MKKFLSILLSLTMLFAVVGSMIIANADETVTFNILDVKGQIRTVGRTEIVADSGIACDWTASGIEFTANCEGDVSLTIESTYKVPDADKTLYSDTCYQECFYTVYIDGVRQSYRVRTMNGTFDVKIAEGLESGLHTFKIVKQTEKVVATSVIKSISLIGTLGAKPAEPEYVFESIGDSITSGYGALDTNRQSARFSDGTRTYAYITAENFGAEARVTSQSGGSITSLYSQYIKNTRDTNDYDYSLKKPTVVTIAFGTNDKAKTVDYWQTGIQQFADAIRTGYNDYSLPIVMVQNLMTNEDAVRANIAQAIKNLAATDAEKYSNIFVTYGNNPQGGHPGQSSHKSVANKLTRDLVEFGIMPASALKSDATVTLNEQTAESETLNAFDNVVAPGSTTTGITGELVAPLDPDDAENDTAYAVKYTADGTQVATSDYRYPQVKIGTVSNTNYRSKGISFYVNYKDTTEYTEEEPTLSKPKLVISAGDKMATVPLDVKDGETTKVEIDWAMLPNVSYVFSAYLVKSYNPTVSLEMTGACEYTIDNVKTLLNKYTYTANSACAYTYSTGYDSYTLMGVTDNYIQQTTAPTTIDASATFTPSDVAVAGNWQIGWYNNTNGTYSATYTNNTRACLKKLVKVESGATYTLAIGNNSSYGLKFVLREYDANGSFLQSYGTVESGGTYTTTSGVSYISITLYDYSGVTALVTGGTITPSMVLSDGAEETSSTTTTAAAAQTYEFSFCPNDKEFTISNSTFTYTSYTSGGSYFTVDSATVGQTATFTSVSSVAAGTYKVDVYARTLTSGRAVIDVSVNGNDAVSVDSNADYAVYAEFNLYDAITVEAGKITVKVDATTAGKIYLGYIKLTPVEVDTTTPSESETTTESTTTTTTTPSIDGEQVIYNMNEDSRPATYGITSRYGYTSFVTLENDDHANVLRYARKDPNGTSATIQDQSSYLKLPTDIWTEYGTPISLKFDAKTDTGAIVFNKQVYFTSSASNSFSSSDSVLSLWSFSSTWNTYTIDLTSGAGLSAVENGYTYLNLKNQSSSSNTANYFYIDNVTLIYETPIPTVTIDGVKTTVADGTFTLPTTADLYLSDNAVYGAGEEIEVTKDIVLTSYSLGLTMQEGASIRLNVVNGIRFYTNVDASVVEAIKTAGATVTMGTLITPADLLGDKDLTLDCGVSLANVVYAANLGGSWNDKGFVGSIVNIKESNTYNAQTGNLNRPFVGRGYITVTLGETTKTIYADYYGGDVANNTRSVSFVANAFKNDSSSNYSSLVAEIKALIDRWASAYTA